MWFLDLDVTGSPWLLLLVALLDALLGTALGLFVSAYVASKVVVLGLPGALGAAAGRLAV